MCTPSIDRGNPWRGRLKAGCQTPNCCPGTIKQGCALKTPLKGSHFGHLWSAWNTEARMPEWHTQYQHISMALYLIYR